MARRYLPGQVDFEQRETGVVVTAVPADGAPAVQLYVIPIPDDRRGRFAVCRSTRQVHRRATRRTPAGYEVVPIGVVTTKATPTAALRDAMRRGRLYARRPAPAAKAVA